MSFLYRLYWKRLRLLFTMIVSFICLDLSAQGHIDCATILNDDASFIFTTPAIKTLNGYTYIYLTPWHDDPLTPVSLPVINGDAWQAGEPTNTYLAVIDPDCNQVFGTYIGGSGFEEGYNMEIDNSGNIVLGGVTDSADFPTTDGTVVTGDRDVYTRKYAPDGTLIFSTVHGGSERDYNQGLVVDGTDIYLMGETTSPDFMTTDGSAYVGGRDMFVIKYDCDGNLIYATITGGSVSEFADNIASSNGQIVLAGRTLSSDFPSTDGTVYSGLSADATLTFYDASGNLIFNTVYGGNGNDNRNRERVFPYIDGSFIYVFGETSSTDFPTTDGSTFSGFRDLYYRKYDLAGNLIDSKLIGGSLSENMLGLEFVNGTFYILGRTNSTDFTTTDGTVSNGSSDALIINMDTNCNILYSTIYGGSSFDDVIGFDVAPTGEVYLNLNSQDPVTTDGTNGQGTTFAKFNADGTFCAATVLNNNPEVNYGVYCPEVINDTLYTFSQHYRSGAISTDGTAYSGNENFAVTKYVFCSSPSPITNDDLSPATIEVCANGLVDQIIGTEQAIDGSTFPTVFVDGAPQDQMDIELNYQWQISNTATGPWTDIPGPAATQKNYSPAPTSFDQYFRRLLREAECCGGALISTSSVVCVEVMDQAPTIDLGGTQYSCPGSPVDLGANLVITGGTEPYTYSWNDGEFTVANPTVNPDVSTVFTLEVTDALGCIQASQGTVSIYEADAGPPLSVCDGEGTLIGGTPLSGIPVVPAGGTPPSGEFSVQYTWTPDDGSLSCVDCPNPTATPTSDTDYELVVTIHAPDGGSCQTTDQVTVTVFPAPAPDFAGPDMVVCLGDEACLGGPPVILSTASISSLTQSSAINGNMATIANLTDGNFATGGHTRDGVTENITIDLGSAQLINSIDLAALSSNTSDDALLLELSVDGVNFNAIADYSSGLSGTIITTVTFPDQLVRYVRLRSFFNFRDVSISEFAAYLGFQYTWTPGTYLATSGSKAIFDAGNLDMPDPNPITYTLTSSIGSCNYYDQVTVAVIEARAGIDRCGPRIVGEGDRTPNIDETYTWTMITDPAITTGTGSFLGATDEATASVSASQGGDVGYKLTSTYTLNGSSATCMDTVIVPPLCGPICIIRPEGGGCPDFEEGNPNLLAIPDSGSASDWTYSWTSNEGMVGLSNYNSERVMLTDNGERTYTVTMTSLIDPSYSCSATIEANLPSYSTPSFTAVSPIEICKGDVINIGDPANNPGLSYQWDNANLLDDPNISYPLATVDVTTQFKVTVTDMVTGCLVEEAVDVIVLPSANAGPDLVVCDNAVVTIGANTAAPGFTYSWEPAAADWRNGTDQFDAMPEAFVAVNQQFILTMVDDAGICTTMDTMNVIVEPLPAPVVLPDLSFCPSQTDPVILGVDETGTNLIPGGFNYGWTGNVSDPNIQNPEVLTPLPTFSTTFEVTYSGPNGCNQTVEQSIVPAISKPITSLNSTICVGESVFIGDNTNPTGGTLSYSWSPTTDLSDPTSNNPEFTPTAAGNYTFTVTVEDSSFSPACMSTSEVTITVLELDPPVLVPVNICEGNTAQIGLPNDASLQYAWSPGVGLDNPFISNPTFVGTTSTDYSLTVFDGNGCSAEAFTSVTVNPSPDVTIVLEDIYVCDPAITSLTLSPQITPAGNYAYSWSPATLLSSSSVQNPDFLIPGDGAYEYVFELIDQATGCSLFDTLQINVDYGNCCEELAGEIYLDDNNNGCQDATEMTMIEGAMVNLWECDPATGLPATMVGSTTSLADGSYSFAGTDPNTGVCFATSMNTYAVEIIPPTGVGETYEGYSLTDGTADAACVAAGESDDVDGTTGISSCYDPAGDDDDMHIDAGIKLDCPTDNCYGITITRN